MRASARCDEIVRLIDEALAANEAPVAPPAEASHSAGRRGARRAGR